MKVKGMGKQPLGSENVAILTEKDQSIDFRFEIVNERRDIRLILFQTLKYDYQWFYEGICFVVTFHNVNEYDRIKQCGDANLLAQFESQEWFI